MKKLLIPAILLIAAAAATFHFTRPKPLDLSVVGFINKEDGLGKQSIYLVRSLHKELKTNLHLTRKIRTKQGTKKIKKCIAKNPNAFGKVVIFEDILWDPQKGLHTDKLRGCPAESIKIAYSMTESTRIPREWTEILNTRFDAVAVPSEFLVQVYEESGVNKPIFVVPLGLHLEHFLRAPLKQARHEVMTFGNLSAGEDRKNHLKLIKAFNRAFGDDKAVQLIINSRSAQKKVRNKITKELATLDAENIEYLQKSLPLNQYLEKFQQIDCYVSPSKGEGFSIQPREAMALGIPVIATNNTAQVEICRSGLILPVESNIEEVAVNPWGDYYGKHFDCTEEDLASALIEMRNNYSSYLAKAKEARSWSAQYDYKTLKGPYHSLIKPKKIVLSTENKVTGDTLTTNSLQLYEKYWKLFPEAEQEVSTEAAFTRTYETHIWGTGEDGEGFSGPGSTVENTREYVAMLETFLKEHNIKTVVDLGCGDWTFSRYIDWSGIDYTGVDVVKPVIERNTQRFGSEAIHFIHANGADFSLPEADLLICKDVMQHLSNRDVQNMVSQLSKYKHCLITNDVDPKTLTSDNPEIFSGYLRFLDLRKPPFNLKASSHRFLDSHGNKKLVLHYEPTVPRRP